MRIAAVILARISSTRLERKVLRDIAGLPMVAHTLRRAAKFPGLDAGKGARAPSGDGAVVLAIPEGRADDELVPVGERYGARVVRGDEEDVLGRLLLAARTVGAEVVYRLTADNPLIDPGVMSATWDGFVDGEWDYAAMEDTPLGTTAEIVTVDALERARELATTPHLREHPTLALYENSDRFKMRLIPAPERWRHPEWRFTVDTEADLSLVEAILSELGVDATLEEIVPFLEEHPEIARINSTVAQKDWDKLKARKDGIRNISV